jgi:hypothetical protein
MQIVTLFGKDGLGFFLGETDNCLSWSHLPESTRFAAAYGGNLAKLFTRRVFNKPSDPLSLHRPKVLDCKILHLELSGEITTILYG